ncbi:GGDEF domain-containing protein [Enterovibrio makurazakiensis]|uniref:GGDEF domain-containing protein n=1 Tax=Enterovibrio makurazakiensis TaxID=2910232 RepID=UPI003D1B4476
MELTYRNYKLSLRELWSASSHASSFNTTRATYLRSRIIALSYVWAVLTLAWIPVDRLVMPQDNFSLVLLRVGLAVALLSIARAVSVRNSLHDCRIALVSLVMSFNVFYLLANHTLGYPHTVNSFSFCYTLLPFLHVIMLTVFPLSIRESSSLILVTALTQLFVDYHNGALLSLDTIAIYWLQTVVGLLVIWGQTSKLHMMLRLYRHATLDPLTGVYNRRMLLTLAQRDIENTRTRARPYSVLIMDLDKFKRINDRYGHFAGDLVLQAFTKSVQETLRKSDIFGRFGGEEFILFLPQCTAENAQLVADRIMSRIRNLNIPVQGTSKPIHVTTSVGISTSVSTEDTMNQLLEKADLALYHAKNNGRDCSQTFENCGEKVQEKYKRPWLEATN